jgi:cytochrome c oxidase assembly factor CtaG
MAALHVIVANIMGAIFFFLATIVSGYIPSWNERPNFWFAYGRAMRIGTLFAVVRTVRLLDIYPFILHLVEVVFAGLFAVLLLVTAIFWSLETGRLPKENA